MAGAMVLGVPSAEVKIPGGLFGRRFVREREREADWVWRRGLEDWMKVERDLKGRVVRMSWGLTTRPRSKMGLHWCW